MPKDQTDDGPKRMSLISLAAAAAAILGSVAAIFKSLASIGDTAGSAWPVIYNICLYSGGFAMFLLILSPLIYINNKLIAAAVCALIFLAEGALSFNTGSHPSASFKDALQSTDTPVEHYVMFMHGCGLYLFGFYTILKRLGIVPDG